MHHAQISILPNRTIRKVKLDGQIIFGMDEPPTPRLNGDRLLGNEVKEIILEFEVFFSFQCDTLQGHIGADRDCVFLRNFDLQFLWLLEGDVSSSRKRE